MTNFYESTKNNIQKSDRNDCYCCYSVKHIRLSMHSDKIFIMNTSKYVTEVDYFY